MKTSQRSDIFVPIGAAPKVYMLSNFFGPKGKMAIQQDNLPGYFFGIILDGISWI
jgi:hypothetical protein